MSYELNAAVAQKVLSVVDTGLVRGMGKPVPGEMCVEAAVCFALGLPHGDAPPCVGMAVRAVKIRLNDSNWSSDQARAKGMRRVAIAQLGSDKIDQKDFIGRFSTELIRQIVPIALRAASSLHKDKAHQAALSEAAQKCENEPTPPTPPTPTSSSGRTGAVRPMDGGSGARAILRRLATPTVHGNYNRLGCSEKSGDGLITQLVRELGGPVTGKPSLRRFVEWMMGFPMDWTKAPTPPASKPSEMPSSRRSRKSSGGQ